MTEVAGEMPDFKLCLHNFFVEEDIIPSVMRFLNHDVDEKCAKVILENKEFSEYVSCAHSVILSCTLYKFNCILKC